MGWYIYILNMSNFYGIWLKPGEGTGIITASARVSIKINYWLLLPAIFEKFHLIYDYLNNPLQGYII